MSDSAHTYAALPRVYAPGRSFMFINRNKVGANPKVGKNEGP